MKTVLAVVSIGEAATGLALLIAPSPVGVLLLGVALDGIALVLARAFGVALISLALACWPGPPVLGMLTYSAALTLYLAWLGLVGGASGILLWPAVLLHLTLTAVLTRATLRDNRQLKQ